MSAPWEEREARLLALLAERTKPVTVDDIDVAREVLAQLSARMVDE
jgi:hypothetical protein